MQANDPMQPPVWRQLLQLLRPFSKRIAIALLLSVVTIGSSIALMMTSAWLISTAALQLGITSLGVAPTGVRMFGISRAVFRYLERLASHDVTFRLLARLRVWFYERIEPLSPAQFEAFSSGDLMARVVTDIEELQNLYIRVVAPPIVAVLVTISVGFVFALLDPLIALIAVSFMLVAGTLLPYMVWWIGKHIGRHLVAVRATMNQQLVDTIQGLPDSLAYGYAQSQLSALQSTNAQVSERERQESRLESLHTGLSVLMTNLAMFCVLVAAIGRVEGVFLAVVALGTIAAFEAITPLALAAQHLDKELTAASRVFEMIANAPVIEEPETTVSAPLTDYSLSIQNVSFRYGDADPYIYEDFSLDLAYGQRAAIVGESGSGKSSLVNILLRFWPYQAGDVSLGGVDLKSLPHEDIRRIFGVMTQRVHLFNTTIMENIRIANKPASDDAIIEAAKAARVHDFIMSLPEGYDTYVGENGVALSGGERQRVALARILLKDAPIWVLDEITANLDPITANEVMASVMQAAEGRTIILMTHHLAFLKTFQFDAIIEL
ncbi:MAG: thiol reductant ABC exporter subunit CydC [Anaerolineaceae bacterium]|nr:thiol reductant ABC exporter subunit CydC [Anaerolineaceae bacterium]